MFIGREHELKFLESRYRTQGGQFVVLYGRRHIGKTEILRKFSQSKERIFYSCADCTDEQQIRLFSNQMLAENVLPSKYSEAFTDWEQALSSVLEIPSNGKRLLIMDDFPHIIKGNASFPSILQNLWDSKLKNEEVMILLCGSGIPFVEKEILSYKNPLYGRATGILKITELSFYEAIQFFPDYSNINKIIAYAVLGGTPHNLKQLDRDKSLDVNIKQNILEKGSILYNEVELLMRHELSETSVYDNILNAVALGNTKLNDIYHKTRIEKSELSAYLNDLIGLGIIQREFPVSDSIEEQANRKQEQYQILDNFFRFWYTFVLPNITDLEAGHVDGIYEYIIKPALDQYTSHVFEDICLEYLRRLNRQNVLPFRFTTIGSCWDKNNELNIMATDRESNNFIIGYCKYTNTSIGLEEVNMLLAKYNPHNEDEKVYYYLFSKTGFTQEVHEAEEHKGLRLITIDDLF